MAHCSVNLNTPRDDGGGGSGGARGTMAYEHFDGLVDPHNSSGLVKLVSTKATGCIYPTSIGPLVEGMGAVAAQDFRGLVEPLSKITNDADQISIGTTPQKFQKGTG
jgi:hypothetical protein